MTYLEIDRAILDITQEMCKNCQARLDSISKENVTERKAVQLEYGMYAFCRDAGLLYNNGMERTNYFRRGQSLLNKLLPKHPILNAIYQALNDENKLCFYAALQGELFIRDQWIGKKTAELAAAEASGDAKNVFEITIMLGAVKNMFAAWEQWRVENNIFPHMFEGDFE